VLAIARVRHFAVAYFARPAREYRAGRACVVLVWHEDLLTELR
jgi:hypothetical protein